VRRKVIPADVRTSALQTPAIAPAMEINMPRLPKYWKEISCLIASIGLCDIGAAFGGGPGGPQGGGGNGNGAQNNTNQINFYGPVSVSGHNDIGLNAGPQTGGSQISGFTNQGSVNSLSSGGTQNLVGAQQAKNTDSGVIVQGGYAKNYLNIQKYHWQP
jgi:hypothetical protein